jgi:hypothetical protein
MKDEGRGPKNKGQMWKGESEQIVDSIYNNDEIYV